MRVKSASAGQICMYIVHVYVGGYYLETKLLLGRMECHTSALKSALDKKHDLQTVVSALENLALPPLLKRESLTAD